MDRMDTAPAEQGSDSRTVLYLHSTNKSPSWIAYFCFPPTIVQEERLMGPASRRSWRVVFSHSLAADRVIIAPDHPFRAESR
jgi:hypothetical protein